MDNMGKHAPEGHKIVEAIDLLTRAMGNNRSTRDFKKDKKLKAAIKLLESVPNVRDEQGSIRVRELRARLRRYGVEVKEPPPPPTRSES